MTTPQPKARSAGRTLAKIIAWLVLVVVILCAAIAVFIATFDWNRAKPWINEKVSEAIGRPFAIQGDIKVGWRASAGETGWRAWVPWPRFSATHIVVANPAWAKAPQFATLDEIDFEVMVLPLLVHDIVIPKINLVNPSVDIERLNDGRNNWTFQLPESKGPSKWKLDLHDIAFAKGNVAVSDQKSKTDVKITITLLGHGIPIGAVMKQQEASARSSSANVIGHAGAKRFEQQARKKEASEASAASAPGPASAVVGSGTAVTASGASAASGAVSTGATTPFYAIAWTIDGTHNNARVTGSGKVGGVLALQDATRPYPVQADVRAGDLHIAFVGTLTDPKHLAAVDLRLWLEGNSMARLYSLTGVTLPETPPYATEGHLVGAFHSDGNVFRYENFTGRVGGSDLSGTLVYFQRKPRPKLEGKVVSKLLQFSDLAPIIGADSNASKAKRGVNVRQPADRVLPVEPFRTDRWSAIDANVEFTGKRIIRKGSLPISDLYTHVVMNDGVLQLEPLRFGLAGGTLETRLSLDGSTTPLKARGTAQARHLKLKQLFPKVQTMQSALGEVNADASLSATGNSPAALAATSNGEVKALVTQGTISLLLMEAAGLNVANVVYEKLFGTRDVRIDCAAADFVATNGVLNPHVFAIDTEDAVIDIDGPINLRDETVNLKVHPHTKGFRVFSLRSPLYAKGTFKNPHVGVDVTALALRGGAAIGLGLINPFAALLPLIAPSHNKPLPCDALFAQYRKAPVAPPPGKKMPQNAPGIPPAGHVDDMQTGTGSARGHAQKHSAPAAPSSNPASPANPANVYKGS